MTSFKRTLRTAAHAAALIFGAFWLVATSDVPGPARDCFSEIGNPTRLQVTLGERLTSGGAPSCSGIDGLAPDRAMVFDMSQGPRPQETYACYAYNTDALTGVDGLTLNDAPQTAPYAVASLTSAKGMFVSPPAPGCTGSWSMLLYRVKWIDKQVSPLDAGPDDEWRLKRQIRINQASSCGGVFTEAGVVTCEDEFVVASIELAP
jgi:hypothetical protein